LLVQQVLDREARCDIRVECVSGIEVHQIVSGGRWKYRSAIARRNVAQGLRRNGLPADRDGQLAIQKPRADRRRELVRRDLGERRAGGDVMPPNMAARQARKPVAGVIGGFKLGALQLGALDVLILLAPKERDRAGEATIALSVGEP